MAKSSDTLMHDIRHLRRQYAELSRSALEQHIEVGRGINEAEQFFKRGEEPPDRIAEQCRIAMRQARVLAKRMLAIDAQTAPLLAELMASTNKRQYNKCLSDLRLTPLYVIKMRRLHEKWNVFEQAVTWEDDRVDQGAGYIASELNINEVWKLVRVSAPDGDKPLDFASLTYPGMMKQLVQHTVKMSMSHRKDVEETLRIGALTAELRQRLPDKWEQFITERTEIELYKAKEAL